MSIALLAVSCNKSAEVTPLETLNSPDGRLRMEFYITTEGTPQYSLSYDGEQVIRPSSLGYRLRGVLKATKIVEEKGTSLGKVDEKAAVDFDRDFELISAERDSLDEVWTPVWGEEDHIRNHYKELLLCLRQKESGKLLGIRFRLFDDGLGFRYEFPAQDGMNYFVIEEELSQFALGGDYTTWWIPGDYDTQEYQYTKCPASEIAENYFKGFCGNSSQTPFSKYGVQTSLQMKTPSGLYVNIHEAACVDYATMHLELNPKTLTFTSVLTPSADGHKGQIQAPRTSPWRTIQITPNACAQLASRLVLNLNEPCKFDDVSWIHPVKYMGVWWEMIAGKSSWAYTDAPFAIDIDNFDYKSAKPNGRHGANTANVKKYIDFAATNGFDAVLVEGWNIGWEDWANCNKDHVFDFQTPYPDFDIEYLNSYAHSKGIRLVMHHETSSSVRNYERYMEDAYTLMNKYGYDAVKSGYVGDIVTPGDHHYSQFMNNHYLYALTQAAKHHIMVNAHEATRPTGLCRTYPNLIGNESARGTEYQAFGGTRPEHVTILPFTRLNGGPMDFTPGIFEQNLKEWCGNDSHVNATIANQLGLYLTMYSPLQMAADTPEHYAEHMDAFQFIRDVAVDWSESRYLDAEVGDYIIVARKAKGSGQWFCGGVTDENARDFEVPLEFLGAGRYEATVYQDAPDADYLTKPQAYTISKVIVGAADKLGVHLAAGGGFAVSFKEL